MSHPMQYRTLEHNDVQKAAFTVYPQSQGRLEQISVNNTGPKFSITGSATAINNPVKQNINLNNQTYDKIKQQVSIKNKFKRQNDQLSI